MTTDQTHPAPADTEPGPATEDAAPVRRRWCWSTRLLVTAAVAWLAFVLLHRLLSGRWWAWVMPDTVPSIGYLVVPVLLAVAVVLARVARRRLPPAPRWGVLGAALLALLLGIPDAGINPYALRPSAAGPVPPDAIHIFAWNTEQWDQLVDPDAFLDFLVRQRADVYLLSEHLYFDPDGIRGTGDLPRLRRAFPGYQIAARGELLTLSRFPIVAVPAVGPDRAVRADPTATAEEIFEAAKVLRTDLRIGEATLSAYNLHLPVQVRLSLSRGDPFTFARENTARWDDQLAGLLSDLAANPHPAVVAGDFNATPAMRALRAVPEHGLADAARHATSLYPVSWQARTARGWWRLDYTFTTAGVPVHRYRLGDAAGFSDHRPQVIRLSLPEQP